MSYDEKECKLRYILKQDITRYNTGIRFFEFEIYEDEHGYYWEGQNEAGRNQVTPEAALKDIKDIISSRNCRTVKGEVTMSNHLSWRRVTKELLDLADMQGQTEEGLHHLPAYAKAMERALKAAHVYYDANWTGAALQALGAFKEINAGYLDKHPEFWDNNYYKGLDVYKKLGD